MFVIFFGNDEYWVYVELGLVICEVNEVEYFCGVGYIVFFLMVWELCI